MKKQSKIKAFFAEFKAFINKGNAFMLAVGVVIGGAFNAIVTSLVNILMSVATWGVPGGLKGLVTVLPAANKTQIGPVGQEFLASDLAAKVSEFAKTQGVTDGVAVTDATYIQWQNTLLAKYTLHGGKYTYNLAATLDWGSFINAFISFIIVALTLFIIVKVMNVINKKNEEIKAKALEQYYEKHPEERPVPPEPGKPAPTEMDVLCEIRDALVNKKAE